MNNTISAAPYANLLGIQDLSAVAPVLNPETLPQHLPHVYLFAQTGPTLPQLVDSSSNETLYGVSTFDLLGPYVTHQTVLANVISANGGSMMVQRVLPSDAGPPATLGLYFEYIAEPALPQYQRNSDGSYSLDVNGAKQQVVGSGATAAGIIGRWIVKTITNGILGAGVEQAGTLTNTLAGQSQVLPILEFQASFAGALGNNLGVSIWAPSTDTTPAVNTSTISKFNAFIYQIQFLARASALSTPNVLQTLEGEQSVEFTFAPNVIDPHTDKLLTYSANVIPSYESLDSPGQVPQYGPYQQMYVYSAQLLTVLTAIFAAEQPAGLIGGASPINPYLINLFNATDPNGIPYYNFVLNGPADGGLLFSQGVTHYSSGGSDGTMTNTTFDAAVQNQLLNWGSLEAPLLDDALYPQSVIYDSGFTLATKLAFGVPMSRRKDLAVILSTQDVSIAQNTPSDESSIAVALRTAMNNYPESTFYGTSVCRAVIVGQSGYLINSPYTSLMPLTLQFAARAITYMGAGNGVWRNGYGFDIAPNNQITMFKGVNAQWKPAAARNADWQTGLVWAQTFDRKSLFWPAVQTVYTDDSSVLNSAITMLACVELEKVAARSWRDLTGRADLTNDQFVVKSNKLIDKMTVHRFDNRFVIVADTFFTSVDVANGNTWSCKITIYAPTMKTIGTFTIVAQRKDRLAVTNTTSRG
jgi:hypothetical protein